MSYEIGKRNVCIFFAKNQIIIAKIRTLKNNYY